MLPAARCPSPASATRRRRRRPQQQWPFYPESFGIGGLSFPSLFPDSVWQPQPCSSLGISRGPLPFRRRTWQCHTPARPPAWLPPLSVSPLPFSSALGDIGRQPPSSPFGPSLFSLLPLPHCRSVTKRRRRRRKRRPMRARGIVASPECHCPLLHSAAAVAAAAARARAAACDSRRQSRQRKGRGGRARRRRRRRRGESG